MPFLLFILLNGYTLAHSADPFCALGACQVTGFSKSQNGKRTFLANCAGIAKGGDRQIEFAEGNDSAQILDKITRAKVSECKIRRVELASMLKNYEDKLRQIESPPCYLTQWFGQMMFVANGVRGRCSFKMNKKKLEEFRLATGLQPTYQCENDYFLSIDTKSATAIYKKVSAGWAFVCTAPMRTGEAPSSIDWNNPPEFYEPEGPTEGPSPPQK